MPEFLRLVSPDEARSRLFSALSLSMPAPESIDTVAALGRVTVEDIPAPHALPEFSRSTVDGYAVRASDTYGATDALPGYLRLIGEIPMGNAPTLEVHPGEAALIHTGGMLPPGADAVVMLEQTQLVHPASDASRRDRTVGAGGASRKDAVQELEVMRSVAVGENVIRAGEDVLKGQVVLPRGMRLRPAEIGGLMALGITALKVSAKPRVGLLSSGDEVIEPHLFPRPGQVRDVNAYALGSLVARSGGEPVFYGIVPDDQAALYESASRALDGCQALIITAGSSASTRDMTAEVIASLGSPGVLVHGVNTRPGKPTILGVCDGKAVVGLPGNPVSALVNGYLFVAPLIERLLGLHGDGPRPAVPARLAVNLPSQAGREDWWPVRLVSGNDVGERTGDPGTAARSQWSAEPIFGKSNLIFNLVAADGLIRIPPDATGLSAGEMVEVFLL